MKLNTKHLVLSLTLAGLLAAPLAEAARFGKSRSSGMQRSAPTQSYRQAAPAPTAPAAAPAPAPAQPARSGPGVGTAIAAGAAGAAAGYMLGNAMSDHGNAAANTAAEKQAAGTTAAAPAQRDSGGLGLGTLLLLALGGFLLFRFMKRRQQAAGVDAAPAGLPPQARPLDPNAFRVNPTGSVPLPGSLGGGFGAAPMGLARLPDGTETPHFLRQAKATFMHLQSMNNPDNVEEVRKYLTPEMFEQLKADISANSETAEFPQLDAEVIDAAEENGQIIASVRFSGMVSESVNAPTVPFAETWHYVKSDATGQKWVVAGIQQN